VFKKIHENNNGLWWEKNKTFEEPFISVGFSSWSAYLFLDGLDSVIGGCEAVAVWGQPGPGVGLDQRKGSLVLLSGDLK